MLPRNKFWFYFLFKTVFNIRIFITIDFDFKISMTFPNYYIIYSQYIALVFSYVNCFLRKNFKKVTKSTELLNIFWISSNTNPLGLWIMQRLMKKYDICPQIYNKNKQNLNKIVMYRKTASLLGFSSLLLITQYERLFSTKNVNNFR